MSNKFQTINTFTVSTLNYFQLKIYYAKNTNFENLKNQCSSQYLVF